MILDYLFLLNSIPILLNGARYTIVFSVISIFFGIIIGLGASLLKISKNAILRTIGSTYIEVIRGTPLLLHIMVAYYGLAAF